MVEIKNEALKVLFSNKTTMFGIIVVVVMVFIAVFAPFISPYPSSEMFWTHELESPSLAHLMGTDKIGRDVFSRVIWGSQTSLFVGFMATAIVASIGVTLGTIAGYYGGIIDAIVMRTVDIFMSFPTMALLLVLAAFFSTRSVYITTLTLGLVYWPQMVRVVQGNVLRFKEEVYVEAAKGLGVSDFKIVTRHILPHIISPIMVYGALFMGLAILIESSLSFLGLGDPLTVSWGLMVANGRPFIRNAWWMTFFPGLAIFFVVMSFNLISDGLRDVLDVRLR